MERCYWPLLRLAEQHPGIGLEISAYTLEEVAWIDPAWVATLRGMLADGRIELLGSGYSQLIGPLVPARVMAENLRIAGEVYRDLLGAEPAIALVNEQAFSAGLVEHYLAAGYRALMMDWDNPSAHHPEWDRDWQYLPQFAAGLDGKHIPVLWTNTAAFQQMQRFVYGDITLYAYLRFVRERRGEATRAICLYASDAEIFDFRPGRFRTEEKMADDSSEWARFGEALLALTAEDGIDFVSPSQVLSLIDEKGGGHLLHLESAACPVPVKKQRKYNLARWAVTGRDNTAINAACERIYRGMMAGAPDASDWKQLCCLWASDFRTHITAKRWEAYCADLKAAEDKWALPPPVLVAMPDIEPATERHLDIQTPMLKARLDRRRGLAIQSLHFTGQDKPVIGGLPHGTFDEIALQADWYTGDCVFEAPGAAKVTDLEWCEARLSPADDGGWIAHAQIETPHGVIEKQLRFHGTQARLDFDILFHWETWPTGVLRLGHVTLLPDAFDIGRLMFATTNGGGREVFALGGLTVDHGAPVSLLVSSSFGVGMTEGWAEITDGKTGFRIDVDRATAPLLGLLIHRPARRLKNADSLFCQFQLSAMELDDTRKPLPYRDGPRRFRFSISAL